MRRLCAAVFLALSLTSCADLRPDAAYVRADRARFDVIEPIVRALADEDPANDPDLRSSNGLALLALLDGWRVQLEAAERANR